jgi:hypothetical protein
MGPGYNANDWQNYAPSYGSGSYSGGNSSDNGYGLSDSQWKDVQSGMNYGGLGDLFGAGLGALGMAGYKNPANAGMGYLNQLPGILQQYLGPYSQAGMGALPILQQQYGNLLNNPTGVMNQIGSTYQQSPGYQWQVNQATGAANRAAAAGGMAGSPMEQQQLAGTVDQLANQDYYNYLSHGLSQYGMGLSGMQGLGQMGLQASTGLGEDLSTAAEAQAQMAYAGAANQNQATQGSLGGIGGLLSGGMQAMAMGGWL